MLFLEKVAHLVIMIGCIVHPGCSIIAQGGDIVFGDFNIIEVVYIIYLRKEHLLLIELYKIKTEIMSNKLWI